MIERLLSGDAQLDRVLAGGIPKNGIALIVGPPGSGKTLLAQQFVFANATVERPAIYFSTVSEPFDKIIRFGQSLSFFDPGAVGKSVLYHDLGATVNELGLDGVLKHLDDVLHRQMPSMMVIDSFKALRAYTEDQREFRRFLHELAGRVSAFPVTSFWVGEYGREDVSDAPEFAVVDAIIALGSKRMGSREHRGLEVLKLRGSSFLSGSHGYRLSGEGICVFPRLADPVDDVGYDLDGRRISSGIEALDTMLGDGYRPGASTVIAGPSGSGKTLLGLHFIFNGVRAGEPGVIATLQENRSQLARMTAGFGWSIEEPGVEVFYRSPVDLQIDQWVYDVLDAMERVGAKRLLIDSVAELRMAATDDVGFSEYAYSLLQRTSRAGISLFGTYEIPELYGVSRVSDLGISHLSDNVVLLQYVRSESTVKRALTVLKTRASDHDPSIREFTISSDGIRLGDPFDALQRWR